MTEERFCEWEGCEDKASTHFRYTDALTDNGEGVRHVPEHHNDLCEAHVLEAKAKVGGYEQDFSEPCSPGCPSPRAKI